MLKKRGSKGKSPPIRSGIPFATHLLEGGADPSRGPGNAGTPRNIVTTEIYTHVDREYLKEVAPQFSIPRFKALS